MITGFSRDRLTMATATQSLLNSFVYFDFLHCSVEAFTLGFYQTGLDLVPETKTYKRTSTRL